MSLLGELRNENIISWTPRNFLTVAVMVTLAFVALHILTGGVGWLTDFITNFSATGSASYNTSGVSENAQVDF